MVDQNSRQPRQPTGLPNIGSVLSKTKHYTTAAVRHPESYIHEHVYLSPSEAAKNDLHQKNSGRTYVDSPDYSPRAALIGRQTHGSFVSYYRYTAVPTSTRAQCLTPPPPPSPPPSAPSVNPPTGLVGFSGIRRASKPSALLPSCLEDARIRALTHAFMTHSQALGGTTASAGEPPHTKSPFVYTYSRMYDSQLIVMSI